MESSSENPSRMRGQSSFNPYTVQQTLLRPLSLLSYSSRRLMSGSSSSGKSCPYILIPNPEQLQSFNCKAQSCKHHQSTSPSKVWLVSHTNREPSLYMIMTSLRKICLSASSAFNVTVRDWLGSGLGNRVMVKVRGKVQGSKRFRF